MKVMRIVLVGTLGMGFPGVSAELPTISSASLTTSTQITAKPQVKTEQAATVHKTEHENLSTEIARLRTKKKVVTLPPYLSEGTDFGEACENASVGGKKRVIVSIGREICTRCQRFYALVESGEVKINPQKYALIRLNVDVPEQREYFMATFSPADNHLPFVGVTDGERNEVGKCLTGRATVEEFRELVGDKR